MSNKAMEEKSIEVRRVEAQEALARRVPPTSIIRHVLVFTPRPLTRPKVEATLSQMPASARMLESLRYSLALLEFRLAPDGWLRAWLLSTLRVLLFVLIPLAAILAIITCLVPVFGGIAVICHSIQAACQSLFWAAVYFAGSLLILSAIIAGVGIAYAKRKLL